MISLVSNIFQYNLLNSIRHGNGVDMNTAAANDLRQQIIAILFIIVYIISAVTFILWFRRAYYNLGTKDVFLSYEDGWAAGSWFIPILNWFRPYQIMKELYTETVEFLNKKGHTPELIIGNKNINLWWSFWLASSIIGQIVFRYSRAAETVDDFLSVTFLSILSSTLMIPLAIFTVKLIKNYSEFGMKLAEHTIETNISEIKKDTSTQSDLQ
jgi:hypothetical protein